MKLNWKPALVATEGSLRIMIAAASARIASPFQSRSHDAPIAPQIAMSALRVALAAGAMSQSAAIAASATGTARQRSSRRQSDAVHATIQPSTARLNPEIARMCASPTARNAFSIAA
jgi:hypothetical protein